MELARTLTRPCRKRAHAKTLPPPASNRAVIPLSAVAEELVTIVRRHGLDQSGDTEVSRSNTLGLVFTTKNGPPLDPRNINRAFELCLRAGVRSLRLHDLRHSCGTLLRASTAI